MTVPDGIAEILAALDAQALRRPVRRRATGTSPESARAEHPQPDGHTTPFPELPLFDLRLQPQDLEAVAETLRSGWLTLGPRTAAFEEAFAAHARRAPRDRALQLHGGAAPGLPGRRRRARRRGDRAVVHVRGDRRRGALLRRRRRCSRRSSRASDPSLDPDRRRARGSRRARRRCAWCTTPATPQPPTAWRSCATPAASR